jgi:hypothetical protein
MPKNTVSAAQPKMKAKAATAPGGRPLGKKARRAASKNNAVVEQFLTILATAKTQADLDVLQTEALQLGRIIRPVGGNRMEVRLMAVEEEGDDEVVKLPIGGNVRGGRGAMRGDRANSMLAGDVVVIRGAQIAAKIPGPVSAALRDLLAALEVPFPKGFFASAEGGEEEEDEGFEFVEESDEEEEAEVDIDAI